MGYVGNIVSKSYMSAHIYFIQAGKILDCVKYSGL